MLNPNDLKEMNFFHKRYNCLFNYGMKNNLIKFYDATLIEELRKYYFGVIPLSIILLSHDLCNSFCLSRASFVTNGFQDDEFNLVWAQIDGLKYNKKYMEEAKVNPRITYHLFAERIKKDGTTWVFDTSSGLIIEKNLYYQMEHPRIISKLSKRRVLSYPNPCKELKSLGDLKYLIPFLMPRIETSLEREDMYFQELKNEIELFKKQVAYENLCQELNSLFQDKGYFLNYQDNGTISSFLAKEKEGLK